MAAQLFHIVEVASTTVVLLGPRKHMITLGLTREEKSAIHVSNAARVGGIELWAAVKNKIHLHKITTFHEIEAHWRTIMHIEVVIHSTNKTESSRH